MGTLAGGAARSSRTRSSTLRGAPSGSGKFRLVVLPFLAAEQSNDGNLASAVTDAVAAALRRLNGAEVISPELSQRDVADVDLAAAQTDYLEYILEGAVSCDGNRVQVNVRLIDLTDCARMLWSRRFIVQLGKLQDWSNQLAEHVIAYLDPVTMFFDGHPRRRKRYGADALLLFAIPLMASMERRKYEQAGKLIGRALELEPDNGMAAAWAAFWQVIYFGQGWTQNLVKASAIAQVRARTALALKPDDAETLAICGHVNSFLVRDYDSAFYHFERAQRVNPTLEFAWLWSALTYCYAGKPDVALERLERYRALTSIEPNHPWVVNIYSVANVFAGNYEKAVASGRRGVKIAPGLINAYKPLIASLGHLGRVEEAKPYVDKLLALEPNFTVERFAKVYPIKYDADREHYMKGLRLAGVPER